MIILVLESKFRQFDLTEECKMIWFLLLSESKIPFSEKSRTGWCYLNVFQSRHLQDSMLSLLKSLTLGFYLCLEAFPVFHRQTTKIKDHKRLTDMFVHENKTANTETHWCICFNLTALTSIYSNSESLRKKSLTSLNISDWPLKIF